MFEKSDSERRMHNLKNYRYLIDFDGSALQKEYFDVLIIGSGIAGVFTALETDPAHSIAILTKETIDISNSVLAQGGIAVSMDKGDSPELHMQDTLYAGAGLCDEHSVWVLVNEAAENIDTLCKYGVNFDRNASSGLSFTREAAHSKNRIIHAGDTTGKEVCDTLTSQVEKRKNVKIKERTFVLDLLTEDGRTKGVLAYDEDRGSLILYLSNIVICATGGYGQIYADTTNPEVATGDGVCMAYRAGAELMDLEFVQFHPTVLYHPQNKSFLISEAVRGEGAILRNIHGEPFMHSYHELKELAPRDVVSRAIFQEMGKTGSRHVYLDITFKGREYLENRFPNIYKTCLGYGIDIAVDYIPVAPAEHYCMGGIRADVYGKTRIPGFYAVGEAACNGIHGANRLASNSLLEGLVFGHKISNEINDRLAGEKAWKKDHPEAQTGLDFNASYETDRVDMDIDAEAMCKDIQRLMTDNVGIVRSKEGLETARDRLAEYRGRIHSMKNKIIREYELQNMLLLSSLVVESALEREESRGAHYRSDFSKTNDGRWSRNIVKRIKDGE